MSDFLHSRKNLAYLAILWVVSLAAILVLWFQAGGHIALISQQYPVEMQAVQPSGHGPYSYVGSIKTDQLSQTETFESPVRLLEDGRALGPSNALHDDIGIQGGGRFSFWKGALYFSTSDNSDPRTNGRRYSLSIPYIPDSIMLLFACLLTGTLTFWNMLTLQVSLPRHKRIVTFASVGILLVIIAGTSFQINRTYYKDIYSKMRTWVYVISFDPARYELRGSDYCNPRYDPERIGKALEQIDKAQDYDFTRLKRTRAYLWGIDRRVALKHIFDTVTRGAKTNMEKHLAILRFLQRVSFHGYFSPKESSGKLAYDPLVYLELGEMWCGDVAHLAIDLFSAAGYEARMVQLGGHQNTEIYYEGDWHYFDADLFSGGEVIFMPDGTIPSVDELSRDDRSTSLDSLPFYHESYIVNSCYNSQIHSGIYYSSYLYYSSAAYQESDSSPSYYDSTAKR